MMQVWQPRCEEVAHWSGEEEDESPFEADIPEPSVYDQVSRSRSPTPVIDLTRDAASPREQRKERKKRKKKKKSKRRDRSKRAPALGSRRKKARIWRTYDETLPYPNIAPSGAYTFDTDPNHTRFFFTEPLLHNFVDVKPAHKIQLGQLHGYQPCQALASLLKGRRNKALSSEEWLQEQREVQQQLEALHYREGKDSSYVPISKLPWIGSAFAYQPQQRKRINSSDHGCLRKTNLKKKPPCNMARRSPFLTRAQQHAVCVRFPTDKHTGIPQATLGKNEDEKNSEVDVSRTIDTLDTFRGQFFSLDKEGGKEVSVGVRIAHCIASEPANDSLENPNEYPLPLWVEGKGVDDVERWTFTTVDTKSRDHKQTILHVDCLEYTKKKTALFKGKPPSINLARHAPCWSSAVVVLSEWNESTNKLDAVVAFNKNKGPLEQQSYSSSLTSKGFVRRFHARTDLSNLEAKATQAGDYDLLQSYAVHNRSTGMCLAYGSFECRSQLFLNRFPNDFLSFLFGLTENDLYHKGSLWCMVTPTADHCRSIPFTPYYWTPGAKLWYLCECFAFFDDPSLNFLKAFLHHTGDLPTLYRKTYETETFHASNLNRIFQEGTTQLTEEFAFLDDVIFLDPTEIGRGCLFYSKHMILARHSELSEERKKLPAKGGWKYHNLPKPQEEEKKKKPVSALASAVLKAPRTPSPAPSSSSSSDNENPEEIDPEELDPEELLAPPALPPPSSAAEVHPGWTNLAQEVSKQFPLPGEKESQ